MKACAYFCHRDMLSLVASVNLVTPKPLLSREFVLNCRLSFTIVPLCSSASLPTGANKYTDCGIPMVTICHGKIETVPNFDSLSCENYEVSRDTELSQIPKPLPILSRFVRNVTSKESTFNTHAVNSSI